MSGVQEALAFGGADSCASFPSLPTGAIAGATGPCLLPSLYSAWGWGSAGSW